MVSSKQCECGGDKLSLNAIEVENNNEKYQGNSRNLAIDLDRTARQTPTLN